MGKDLNLTEVNVQGANRNLAMYFQHFSHQGNMNYMKHETTRFQLIQTQ